MHHVMQFCPKALALFCFLCAFSPYWQQHCLAAQPTSHCDASGFSSYPDPEAPTDPSSVASLEATFGRLNTTLGFMDKVAQSYGKFDTGMYAGQYIKQGLAVEYATTFHYPDQTADQQLDTQLYFGILKSYSWFLGALWWEPTYGFNNYEGRWPCHLPCHVPLTTQLSHFSPCCSALVSQPLILCHYVNLWRAGSARPLCLVPSRLCLFFHVAVLLDFKQ